jgi:hypothetical protein
MRKAGRAISLYSVLKTGTPQAALLMLDCDRSLASHRYTSNVMTQKMVMTAIAIAMTEEEKMEMRIADDGSISAPTDWILSTCLSIVR